MKYLIFVINILKVIGLIIFTSIGNILKFFIPKKYAMKSVNNKVVLITGAGNGLGAALAIKFAKQRCRLVLWETDIDSLKIIIDECKKYQSDLFVLGIQVDISNRSQIINAADMVKTKVGFVDIIINNAGVAFTSSITEMEENNIRKTLNVNGLSQIWIVQSFLQDMFSRNSGHIVSISSFTGLVGVRKLADYCFSKFAVAGFQESLLHEIYSAKKSGLHVLTVYPFHMKTKMFQNFKFDCPILKSLEVEYVASKIEEAILTNATVLYLPKLLHFLVILKYVLPTKCFLCLLNVLLGIPNNEKKVKEN